MEKEQARMALFFLFFGLIVLDVLVLRWVVIEGSIRRVQGRRDGARDTALCGWRSGPAGRWDCR
jgi:hypothetical protein